MVAISTLWRPDRPEVIYGRFDRPFAGSHRPVRWRGFVYRNA